MAPKAWFVVAALLLLPLVCNVSAEGKPLDTPELDLSGNADRYAAFMSSIERVLRSTTSTPLPIKNRRPVLGVQKYNPQLLYILLKARDGMSSMLALRTDNVYLVGFKTKAGSWYTFKGDERFIKPSTRLGFGGDYASLKGGHRKLVDVVIGKKAAQDAVATLASYTGATPDQEIKDALTSLVVMICEATRFAPIRAAVKAAWEDGGKFPQGCVPLVVLWRDTSCALLVWNRDQTKMWDAIPEVKRKEIKKYGDPKMDSVDAALDNVYLILRPSEPCSDGKTSA